METITFPYPGWFILLCLALGAVYALALYFRSRSLGKESGMPGYLPYLLGFFRFSVVSIITFLLLGPVIKKRITETENPLVVLLSDNSESVGYVLAPEDSARLISGYQKLIDALSVKYEVAVYSFSSDIQNGLATDFKGKSTNISGALRKLHDLYINRNVGAIILSSDGIYNEGNNPVYTAPELNAPIYTIALGDTSLQRDLAINALYANSILYLGDKMEVKVDIQASNAKNLASSLNLYEIDRNGKRIKIQSVPLQFNSNEELIEKRLVIEPKQTGVVQYQLSLAPLKDEVTLQNNSRSLFVEVLNSRKKVLILAEAPHPDIGAIRQALQKSKNYEVDVAYADDDLIRPEAYNFIILHGLPSSRYPLSDFLQNVHSRHQAVWYIYSLHTNLNLLSEAQNLVSLSSSTGGTNEARPVFNKDFSLFTLPDHIESSINEFPPLLAPFGNYGLKTAAHPLLFQKIGNVTTAYPLLLYGNDNQSRTALLLGTGIWRWRLYDYLMNGNHLLSDELITQSAQFLSVAEDKRQFRVKLAKKVFDETEPVLFSAELYNENYELINDPDVELVIIDSSGKEYPYRFNKSGKAYQLNAGYFPSGKYQYRASVAYNGKEFSANGRFIVQKVDLELLSTRARHDILFQISRESGGKLFAPDRINDLIDEVNGSETLKPILRDTFQTRSLMEFKWIFFLLIILLSMEWFLRKYFGSY